MATLPLHARVDLEKLTERMILKHKGDPDQLRKLVQSSGRKLKMNQQSSF